MYSTMEERLSKSQSDLEQSITDLPPKIARHCRSPKRFSLSSKLYDNMDDTPMDTVLAHNSLEVRKYATKQSQRLPRWAWVLIAKGLGIPLHGRDKPILATILHLLTFSSAITFVISQVWYIVYDIASVKTKQDTLSGSVSIVIAVIWAALGLYAKSLSGRLFRHPRFLGDIRMHARTIFKINAALLVFLLGLFFIVVQDLQSAKLLHQDTCLQIEMELVICQLQFVSRVVFSVFSLVWNTLVAIVLISLCRTHTIGIRRFIRELEFDALLHDHYYCQQFQEDPMSKEDICEETFWLEEDLSIFNEDNDNHFVVVNPPPPSNVPNQSTETEEQSFDTTGKEQDPDILEEVAVTEDEPELINNTTTESAKFINIKMSSSNESLQEDSFQTPHTMTTAEILHKYWKISCRLRMTSCALQRWMASLISLVIVWCFVYLIHWQNHTPSVQDVLQFSVPLLLLPLLCSAFAEVNMEGNRMTQCLCPTLDRLPLLRFLGQNPLNMTIFGVSLSYGTIMTVVFAIFAAFTSRLIFAEMSKGSS